MEGHVINEARAELHGCWDTAGPRATFTLKSARLSAGAATVAGNCELIGRSGHDNDGARVGLAIRTPNVDLAGDPRWLDKAGKASKTPVNAAHESEVSDSNLDLAEQLWQACQRTNYVWRYPSH
jgi:hypothetical protein